MIINRMFLFVTTLIFFLLLVLLFPSDLSADEDARLVREVLLSSRSNIDFIHEIFRQALCLSFRYSEAIKTVILCYKDWIQMVKLFCIICNFFFIFSSSRYFNVFFFYYSLSTIQLFIVLNFMIA